MKFTHGIVAVIALGIVATGSWVSAQVAADKEGAGNRPKVAAQPLSPQEAAQRLLDAEREAGEDVNGQTARELRQKLRMREVEQRRLIEEMEQLRLELDELRIENRALRMAMDTLRDKPIIVEVRQGERPVVRGNDDDQPGAKNDAGAGNNPNNGAQVGDGDKPAADDIADPDKPRWTTQYSLGLIDQGGRFQVVRRADDGSVFIRSTRDVDRDHVIIRGNFKNESAQPYRYAFDIRIGGRPAFAGSRKVPVIGEWRYQTPVLDPGQIHQFEVKIPVSHVSNVYNYALGNVVADQPGKERELFPDDENE